MKSLPLSCPGLRAWLAASLLIFGLPIAALSQPVVTAATPARIELVPGGIAATIDLAGKELQLVDQAFVLENGAKVPAVEVRLGTAARDGSRRQVLLTALGDARPARALELTLLATTRSRDPIRVPLDLSVAAAPEPTPALESVAVTPAQLEPGETASLTVALDGPAPSGGAAIAITADDPVAGVPAEIVVAAGEDQATASFTAGETDAPRTVTLRATYDGLERTGALDIVPVAPALSAIEATAATYAGGEPVPLRIVLDRPAGPAGVSIPLAARDPAAQPPAEIVVPAGSLDANVEVPTSPVSGATPITVVAQLDGVERSVSFTLQPAAPSWPVAVVAGQLQFTPEAAPVAFTPVNVSIGSLMFTPTEAPVSFTPATIEAGRFEFTPQQDP